MRLQARRANGRFIRNTLENTFGLRCITCPKCQRFNPYGLKEQQGPFPDPRNRWDIPKSCHNCGALLEEERPGT